MLIPFNRQQQLLKSFYPSMSPRGIPLRNINLPLLPPPLFFCPVKSQSPWEAGSGCREEDHISRQSPILCQKGDTLQTGPCHSSPGTCFSACSPSHTSALTSRPGEAACWHGEANGLSVIWARWSFTVSVRDCTMNTCHLNYLCPLCSASAMIHFVDSVDKKKKIYYTMRRYARWRGLCLSFTQT